MSTGSNVIMDDRMTNRSQLQRMHTERAGLVDEVAARGRVLDLASFLGLDSRVIADVLVDAVDQDPELRAAPALHHAA